jgi:hypothetical protein
MALASSLARTITAAIVCAIGTAAGVGAQPATRPDPRLTPEEVVGVVLEALRTNDQPSGDRGIAITFAFSSPANREAVGPFERFVALVKAEPYRPILNHRRAERGLLRVDGDAARERVVVTTADGARIAYVFTLSRQTAGSFKDCWMTDGVVRESAGRGRAVTIAE